MSNDPVQSLEDIISSGCVRLLTSGQSESALHGAERISKLIIQSRNRIIVMPGGGINQENVEQLLRKTGASEIHASCKTEINSQMVYRNNSVNMGSLTSSKEYSITISDANKIQELRNKAESFLANPIV